MCRLEAGMVKERPKPVTHVTAFLPRLEGGPRENIPPVTGSIPEKEEALWPVTCDVNGAALLHSPQAHHPDNLHIS